LKFTKDVLRLSHTKEECDKYSMSLESRLRACVKKHRDVVLSFSSDLELVRGMMVSRIVKQIEDVNCCKDYIVTREFVRLASIDVALNIVQSLLLDLRCDSRLSSFFDGCLDGCESWIQDPKKLGKLENFVSKTHVTLAHHSSVSQNELRILFEPLVGELVTISIVGFMWTQRNAAFVVTVPNTTNSGILLPRCKNNFPHMTVWHLPGTSAAASNDLPSLAACHEAESIDFDLPKEVEGVIGLWL
jgi:hypothetical protein